MVYININLFILFKCLVIYRLFLNLIFVLFKEIRNFVIGLNLKFFGVNSFIIWYENN